MHRWENRLIAALVLAAMLATGCGTATTPDTRTIQTQVAASIFATQTADVPTPTLTPSPTNTPYPTQTPVPSATPTSVPTNTPTVIPTATPLPMTTPLPTFTPAPTNTPKPTDTPRPTNTPQPTERPVYVPGIEPVDVTGNVEKRFGMNCGAAQSQEWKGVTYYSWDCFKFVGTVQSRVWVETRRLYTIDTIDASMMGSNANTAIALLQFVASIPFIDYPADQQKAMTWVATTVPLLTGKGDERQTTVRGVDLHLLGLPTAPRLIIGRYEK